MAGSYSQTKVYIGGVYYNMMGENLKTILATGYHIAERCWVTWAIGNSLYKSYDVVQHFL